MTGPDPLWSAPIDLGTDAFADAYDELPLWSAPFARLLLTHVPLRRGDRVLDVGAGTGFLALELAQRCGPDARVTAVDPWGAALRRLERKCAALGVTNVRTVEAPIEAADLPEAEYDLVVSNLGVNNFAEPDAALARCRTLLRRGGEFVLTTNTRGHMAEFHDAFRQVLTDLALPEAAEALERAIARRATPDGLADQLVRAGFAVTLRAEDTFVMRIADGTSLLRHYFVRFAFLPGWRDVCPPDRSGAVLEKLRARLDAQAVERGALALTVPMLCLRAVRPD